MNIKRLHLTCMAIILAASLNKPAQAQKTWEEANDIGLSYALAGRMVEARRTFEAALRLAKNERQKIVSTGHLARVDSQEGRHEAARQKFDIVLASPTQDNMRKQIVQIDKAQTFVEERNWDKARAEYEKSFDLQPTFPDAELTFCRLIAQTYLEEKRCEDARKTYDRLFKTRFATPSILAMAFLQRGEIYEQESRFEDARGQYLKIAAMNNASENDTELKNFRNNQHKAQANFARTYFAEKNFPLARSEYQKLLAMEKLNPQMRAQATEQLKQIDAMEKK